MLRKLRSPGICSKLLEMFCQSVTASVIFYAAACWEDSITNMDARRLGKAVKKAGRLDTLRVVQEQKNISTGWSFAPTAIRLLNSHTNRTWVMSDTQVSLWDQESYSHSYQCKCSGRKPNVHQLNNEMKLDF